MKNLDLTDDAKSVSEPITLPEWITPKIAKIELKRTLLEGGSGQDGIFATPN